MSDREKLEDEGSRYEFSCSKCGHVAYFERSIMMEMGFNSGHGTCSQCKTFLHLEVSDEANKKGISMPWEQYRKQETERMGVELGE